MKIKNKGKVHPSPSSSSSSSSSSNDREVVVLSVLSLLPAAILALASDLYLEDREVLAYMLTRSLKTTSSSSSSSSSTSSTKKKPSKKPQTNNNNNNNNGVGVGVHVHGHNKPPMFECECFDCYTSFWVRWDNSANRDLIHRVIEAFEDHLTSGEKQPNNRPNKKRSRSDKLGRREAQKPTADVAPPPPEEDRSTIAAAASTVVDGPQNAVVSGSPPEVVSEEKKDEKDGSEHQNDDAADDDVAAELRTMAAASGTEHRGLARKVLPDVLGLLNSRLWSLWNPNA